MELAVVEQFLDLVFVFEVNLGSEASPGIVRQRVWLITCARGLLVDQPAQGVLQT